MKPSCAVFGLLAMLPSVHAGFFFGEKKTEDDLVIPEGTVLVPLRMVNNMTAYAIDLQIGTPPQNVTALLSTMDDIEYSVQSPSNPACKEGFCSQFGSYNHTLSSTANYSGPGFNGSGGTGSFVTDQLCLGGLGGKCLKEARFGVLEKPSSNRPITRQQAGTIGLGTHCETANCTSISAIVDQLYKEKLIKTRSYSMFLGKGKENNTAPWYEKGHILFGGIDIAKRYHPTVVRSLQNSTRHVDSPQRFHVKSLQIKTIWFRPWPLHMFPLGGVEFTIDPTSTRWTLPKVLKDSLYKRWNAKEPDENGRVEVNCGPRFKDGGRYVKINFGVGVGGKDEEMIVIPNKAILKDSNKKCWADLDVGEEGGVWGQPFLRSVYLTINYDNMTMEMSRIHTGRLFPPFPDLITIE